MAKDRKKVIHMHSSVSDKQPTPASLEVGELAVNFSADKEFISLKNSSNKVVRISSDEQLVDWMEYKTVIPYSGTVDNVDLTTNKSNIEIKLNQVVSNNTKFHEKVNGALDIDGIPINPTDDGGITNGAGIAIDTSMFALNGGNPVFSSITSLNSTELYGDTIINSGLTVNGTTILNDGLASSLEWVYGDVTNENGGETNFSGNSTSTIVIPNDASHISRKTLSVDYLSSGDSMSGKVDEIYDPGAAENTTAYTPAYVNNLGRGTLEVIYETSACTLGNAVNTVYDPGSKASFTGEIANTIYIPKTIEALDNACGECISISKDVCVDGKISATQGVYQSSDRVLKENIKTLGAEDIEKAKQVQFVSFNFKNDANRRKTYGVIAQDVENAGLSELVHYDGKGLRTVDYTGLLLLKIAKLEKEIDDLKKQINK